MSGLLRRCRSPSDEYRSISASAKQAAAREMKRAAGRMHGLLVNQILELLPSSQHPLYRDALDDDGEEDDSIGRR